MRSATWLIPAVLLLPVAVAAAPRDRPPEITQKHWSFQAMEDLAARGLVHGYRDARFLDGKTLSRFEMASLVKRVMDSIMELPDPGAEEKAAGPSQPSPAATRGLGQEPIPTGRPAPTVEQRARIAAFREADLGTVRRLADEYSVELAVIGVNLQEAMAKMDSLEGRVEKLEKSLEDPKGPLQTVISNVARMDKIRFSGYLQARYQAFETERENDPDGSGPLGAINNTFSVRRMRLNVGFRPNKFISGRYSFDGGGGGNANTRDAYVAYHFKGDPVKGHTVSFGQMNPPFGFEQAQSSSVRESPERARITQAYFPDERDRGFKVVSPSGGRVIYEFGVFNGAVGSRPGRNADDNNSDKDVMGRLRTSLFKEKVDVGVSANLGTSALGSGSSFRENTRKAFGLDIQAYPLKDTTFRFEGIWGEQQGVDVHGWYATVIQNIGQRWQGVVKYDWIGADGLIAFPIGSPGSPVSQFQTYSGTASNLSLGAIYQLDKSTRLKFFWERHGLGRSQPNGRPLNFHGDVYRLEVVTVF